MTPTRRGAYEIPSWAIAQTVNASAHPEERPYVIVCMPPPLGHETYLVHERNQSDDYQAYVVTHSTHRYAESLLIHKPIRQPCITSFDRAPRTCLCGRFDLKRNF